MKYSKKFILKSMLIILFLTTLEFLLFPAILAFSSSITLIDCYKNFPIAMSYYMIPSQLIATTAIYLEIVRRKNKKYDTSK